MKQYGFTVHYIGAFLSILIVTALMAWLGAFGDTGVTSSVTAEQPSVPGTFFNDSEELPGNETEPEQAPNPDVNW